MLIFANEKDFRNWKRNRGLKHEKDRVSYRKPDGSVFHGPRHGESFKPRERAWGYPDEVNKILSKDYGWRAEKYDVFGSVEDEKELRNEYMSDMYKQLQLLENQQKKVRMAKARAEAKCSVNDGMVDVLISRDFGSGWVTENESYGYGIWLAVDSRIIDFWKKNPFATKDEIEDMLESCGYAVKDGYLNCFGWQKLGLVRVPVGKPFRIGECDGREYIDYLDLNNYWVIE